MTWGGGNPNQPCPRDISISYVKSTSVYTPGAYSSALADTNMRRCDLISLEGVSGDELGEGSFSHFSFKVVTALVKLIK